MKLESIHQEVVSDTDRVITSAVIDGVHSHCILARQMITLLGRPGVDNDMEMLGTNDTWTIIWSKPHHTLQEAINLVSQAIAPYP